MSKQLDPSSCVIARTRLKLPSGDMAMEGDPIGPYLENNKKHRWCTEAWISDALRAGHLREATETELAEPAPSGPSTPKGAAPDKKAEAAAAKKKKADAKKAKAAADKKKKEDRKKGPSAPNLPPPTG